MRGGTSAVVGSAETENIVAMDAAYEATLALHALAVLTGGSAKAGPDRFVELVRYLAGRGELLSTACPLPLRPLRYDVEPPLGLGALLAEDLGGAAGLRAELAAVRAAGLLEVVYELAEWAEEAAVSGRSAGRGGAAVALGAPRRDGVHVLLKPVADWSAVAAVAVDFHPVSASAAAATPPAGRVGSASWSPLTRNFVVEADRAVECARRLLAGLGRPQAAGVRAFFDGMAVQSPSTFSEGTAAGAVALTYLAREAGLPSPAELGVFVVADVTADGRWRPSRHERVAVEAARACGLRVLAVGRDGEWSLDGEGGVQGAGTGLAAAAHLLWGEGWQEAQDRWHGELLREHGWKICYVSPGARSCAEFPSAWGRSDGLPVVEPPQVGVLQNQYVDHPRLGTVLGGPPNSGKTVIAYRLARRLEKLRWKVLVMAPSHKSLSAEGFLPALVRAAMALAGLSSRDRVLVVIEDLQPLEAVEIGDAVSSVVSEVGVGVLALARYSAEAVTEWESGTVSPVVAVVGAEEVAALAERMVEECPEVYGGAAQCLPALVKTCNNDLWLLGRLMRELTFDPRRDPLDRVKDLVERHVRERAAGIPRECREPLWLVAALSELGEPVPVEYVPQDVLGSLTDFGVRRVDGGVQIPSQRYADSVLGALASKGKGGSERRRVVVAHLVRLLREQRSERILSLLRVCRSYDPYLLSEILGDDEVGAGVAEWTQAGDVSTVASALVVCDRVMRPGWVAELLPKLIRRVVEGAGLSARRLSQVLRLIIRHHHHIQESDLDAFMEWLSNPETGLVRALNGATTMEERYFLARNVFRLYRGSAAELVVENQERFLQEVNPASARDLIGVRRLDKLVARCLRQTEGLHFRRPLETEPQVQDLLEYSPPPGTGAGALMAWLSIQVHFRRSADWDELISSYRTHLANALRRSAPSEIAAALNDLAENHRGFCTRLLNTLRVADQLRGVLRDATPAEAANLISTVSRIHSATVRYLLYREVNGVLVANSELASALVKRIRVFRDIKGAGMLLISTHRADELYCSTREGFAERVAEGLGRDFALQLVRHERRPSILYYFLRGLWEARASYRKDVESSALELIVRSLKRGGSRHWAARLALLLAEDDYFGEELLGRLSERIDPEILALRMSQRPVRTESFVHLHRLGQAVHPDIPQRYRGMFDMDAMLSDFTAASPGEVAQKLRVAARTLMMSGFEDAAIVLLRRFGEVAPAWSWGEQLRRAQSVEELTQTLDNLRKFDPATANITVEELGTVAGQERFSVLQDFVLRSAGDPSQVTELLRAVNAIEPRWGLELLATLRQHGQRWETFTNELKYEQDPSSQGRIGRHLARMGVLPGRGDLPWMKELVEEKWLKVVHLLASPRAVTELLKLSFVWDDQWGQRLAGNIDHGKVLSRIRLGATEDLRAVPGLLNMLFLTRQYALAAEVVGCVEAFDDDDLAGRMGLAGACQLLRQLYRYRAATAEAFGAATARLLDTGRLRHLVIDQDSHWFALGWAAQTLRELGLESLLPTGDPVLRGTLASAAELCWAATWYSASEWARDVVGWTFPVLLRSVRSWRQGDRLAIALVAGARSGRVEELVRDDVFWRPMVDADTGLLTVAFREALKYPELTAVLKALKPALQQRVRSRVYRIDPWVGELRSLVARVPDPPGTSGGLFGPGGPFGAG